MRWLALMMTVLASATPQVTFAQKPAESSGEGDLTGQLEEALRPAMATGVIDESMIEALMLAAYVASGSPIESGDDNQKPGQEDRAVFGELYQQLAEAVQTGQMTNSARPLIF